MGHSQSLFKSASNSPISLKVNATVAQIAVADFTHDGRQDLVVAELDTGRIRLLPGDGLGGFAWPGSMIAISRPNAVAVADFNGDGNPDLAVTSYDESSVTILLGDGSGNFTKPSWGVLPVEKTPQAIVAADFNDDGKPDLAVSSWEEGRITILLGNAATGGYHQAAGSPFAVGTRAYGLAVGDFDNDGKADLAVALARDGQVGIWRGLGQGAFIQAAGSPLAVAGEPRSLAAGDFNHDGKADLAVLGNDVRLLLGNGIGGFTVGGPILTGGSTPQAILPVDFNADGKLDLAVTQGGEGTVSILAGDGEGGFGAPTRFPAGDFPFAIAAGDFDGDGMPDLAVSDVIGSSVGVLLSGPVQAFDSGAPLMTKAGSRAAAVVHAATATTITLLSSPNPSTYGQAVTLTATVTAGANGKVTFYDGATVVGVATLAASQATLTTRSVPSGTRTLHAHYSGDLNYAASDSATLSHTVTAGSSAGFETVSHATGRFPSYVAVGDFNGDGRSDLAIPLYFSASVSVLLGNGDGTFQPAALYAVGTYPESVVVGDFDGDGRSDLAVANTYSNDVSVLLGNGNGTFQPAVFYPTGDSLASLLAGDFDGDGKTDLALTNQLSNNVKVLLGNGDGTFRTAVDYQSIGRPTSMVAGDFDGDGKTDLAVANRDGNTVSVFLANGDGTFRPAAYYPAGSQSIFVTAGDFNGDHREDLAVANSNQGGTVSVLLGNGDGTFQLPVFYAAGAYPGFVVVADFNGDSKADLAAYSNGSVSVLLGNGDGTFKPPLTYPTGSAPGAMAVGDFNGDNKTDLAIANTNSHAVTVLRGTAAQTLRITKTHVGDFTTGQVGAAYRLSVNNPGFTPGPSPITVTDILPPGLTATAMSGSGWACDLGTLTCTRSATLAAASYPDITVTVNVARKVLGSVLTNQATVATKAGVITASNPANIIQIPEVTSTSLAATPNPSVFGKAVILVATVTAGATGKVTFYDGTTVLGVATLAGARATLTTRFLPSGTRFLRAHYGGDADYAASDSAPVSQTVTAAAANGLAAAVNYPTAPGPRSIVAGDFNRDGKTDLATANLDGNNISILLGNGDGTFQPKQDYAAGTKPVSLVVSDFDGDGNSDLAMVHIDSNLVSVLMGNGDGTFKGVVSYAAGVTLVSLVVADFNGDGKPDLFAGSKAYDTNGAVFLGNGNGTFQSAVHIAFSDRYYSISIDGIAATGDFNNDGRADLVLTGTVFFYRDNIKPAFFLFLGNGDGTFGASRDFVLAPTAVSIATGDLNGDGMFDIITANSRGDVSVLLGNGAGLSAPAYYTVGNTPAFVAVGDANGDGKLDVIAANIGTHNLSVLLGKGDGTFQPSVTYAAGTEPRSVVAGDFNGDGRTDLAVANHGSNNVSVLLGGLTSPLTVTKTHSGDFMQGQTGASYTIVARNAGPAAISGQTTVVDILPGALTATSIAGGGWSCVLGTLTCTRSDSLGAGASYPPITLTVNVDRNAPAQVSNQASVSSGGSLPAITRDITFITPTAAPLPPSFNGIRMAAWPGPYLVTVGEFNRAGVKDLILLNPSILSLQPPQAPASIQLGNGDGTFHEPQMMFGYAQYQSAVVTDLNGDGKDDVLASTNAFSTIEVRLGLGNGQFRSAPANTLPRLIFPTKIAVTDFNGDGKPDLFWIGYSLPYESNSTNGFFLGQGDGSFQSPSIISGKWNDLAGGDFNRDGVGDIVFLGTGQLSVLLGNRSGLPYAPSSRDVPGSGDSVAVGDFNSDGIADVIVSAKPSTIYLLAGNGDGTFKPAVAVCQSCGYKSIVVADLNGDGNSDVAAVWPERNGVSIVAGNGRGGFLDPVFVPTDSNPVSVAAGDFNSDGRIDLITANNSSSTLTLLINTTPAPLRFDSVPSGMSFLADGILSVTPRAFSWTPGSTHAVQWVSPQGGGGVRNLFTRWNDENTSPSRTITAPSGPVTYEATFRQQYLLTTIVKPAQAGTVSTEPVSPDNYFDAGSSLTIRALPNSGYSFSAFSGALSGPTSTQRLMMEAPRTVIAEFGVSKRPTITTLVTSYTGPAQPVTLIATVTFTSDRSGVPTGSVTFHDGGSQIPGSTTLLNASGAASFTATLGPGTHSVTAAFTPADGSAAPSVSSAVTVVVGKAVQP